MEETSSSDNKIFVPITSDYGFKATFGNESHPLFLKKALQALIKSKTPIKHINYVKNAFEGLTIDSRSGIYDVACTDENDNHFIVEMQMGHSPNFIQRMKFYGLHKLNVLVKKGEFNYAKLPKIYCVALLEKNILPYTDYHSIVNLRNEKGELIDSQMTFVIAELDKFNKIESEVETDLDKLLWIMKNLHKTQPMALPIFINEDWLKQAIGDLDTRQMSIEERYAYEYALAANAEVVNADRQKNRAMVEKMLRRGKLTPLEISEDLGLDIDFVLSIQNQINLDN
jgi:predicted transposase/invertase (TIGR01784 family)